MAVLGPARSRRSRRLRPPRSCLARCPERRASPSGSRADQRVPGSDSLARHAGSAASRAVIRSTSPARRRPAGPGVFATTSAGGLRHERGVGQLALGLLEPPSARRRGPSPAGAARRPRRSPAAVSSSHGAPAPARPRWRSARSPSPGSVEPEQRAGCWRSMSGQHRAADRRPGARGPAGAGRSPWSERNRRTSVTSRCSAAISASAAGSWSAGPVAPDAGGARWPGHGAIITESPPVSAVQSSSVTNGITGCSSRSSRSSTWPSTVAGAPARRPGIGPGQLRLGQLQVPVADLVPGEVVERVAGLAELELLEQVVDLGGDRGRAGTGSTGRPSAGPPGPAACAGTGPRSAARSGWRSTACCRSCGRRRPTPR